MVLEYLFLDKASQEEVKKFNDSLYNNFPVKQLKIDYKEFDSQEYWAIKYEYGGNGETQAKLFSAINGAFITVFNPIVLVNESAEYFNKVLYPLINKFERYLRKFLYIRVVQFDVNKFEHILKEIETKDFGEIYNILFVDHKFISEVKSKIKSLNTRAEILDAIADFEENTAWDILVNNGTLSLIKENFDKIKDYRNDVMHAHNINFDTYKKAKKLFNEANSELEKEIQKNIDFPHQSSEILNEELYEKLKVISKTATVVGKGLEFFLNLYEEAVKSGTEVPIINKENILSTEENSDE